MYKRIAKNGLGWLAACAVMLACIPAASADTETVGGVEWSYDVSEGEATVTWAEPASGDLAIPSILGGCPVTGIGDWAFEGCTDLTGLTIPDTVASIGSAAFAYCSGLTSVTIPDSVTSIGSSAFASCSGLTSVTIPDSVTSIEDGAFSDCTSLANVTIPDSVECISPQVFYGCSGLTDMAIPDGVTSIGVEAFSDCNNLTNVTIPESVTEIGSRAFFGCATALYDTNSVPGVQLVDGWAVGNSGTLAGALDLTGVRGIAEGAFFGCDGLTEVTLPAGVGRVGDSAFSNCGGLASVTIPDGVTNIGSFAFFRCTSLTDVTIPDGVTVIGECSFSESGLLSLSLPAGLTEIRDRTFQGASNLVSVQLPAGVERIGYSAFADCTSLESVTLPASVADIADSAFNGCTSLSAYVVANGNAVYSSADGVLFDAAGTTLLAYPAGRPEAVYTIPAGVEAIQQAAFSDCRTLETLEVAMGNMAYSSVDGALYNREGTELLVWPHGKGGGNVVVPPGTLQIGDSVFQNREDLVSVTLPEGLQRIGRSAFSGCRGLAAVELPEGLKRIESSAFYGTGLETVTVPKSVRWIGGAAFASTPLQSATVLGGAISGNDGAFVRCSSLETLTLGTRVSAISYYAFADYSSRWVTLKTVHAPVSWEGKTCPLSGGFFGAYFTTVYDNEVDDGEPTEEEEEYEDVWDFQVVDGGAVLGMWSEVGGKVVIPSTLGGYPVTAIADFAFYYGGDVLTSLRIPDSVASVGSMAFANCKALTALSVPGYWQGTSMLANAGVPAGCTVVYRDEMSQLLFFDPAGGTCGTASGTYVAGTAYGTLPTPKWTGHVFLGWYTEKGKHLTRSSTVTAEPIRTVYARWADRQTVTFDANGGTCGETTRTVDIGGKYGPLPTPTRDNHVFLGWFTQAEGGKQLTRNSKVDEKTALTVYAQWSNEQTVTFDANGGTCGETTRTVVIGGKYGTLPTPTRGNHVFLGWFTQAEGGKQLSRSSKVTTQPTRTLYAQWTNEQTVTFDATGGECDPATKVYTMGGKYSTLPTPTRDNHVFLGWFTQAEGGKQLARSSTVTVKTARTLYAQWTNEQTVTFDAHGGTCDPATMVYIMGGKYRPLPTPTWKGHVFEGWYTAAENGRKLGTSSVVTKKTARTIHAYWSAQASGMTITGFSLKKAGLPATRDARAAAGSSVLTFDAQSGRVYELQWAATLDGEWTTLRTWTAEADGEASVEVPADSTTAGFYRLATPAAAK